MANKDRIEAVEYKLNELIDAHRALHTRHEALMMSFRVLLPFMKIDPTLKRSLMTMAYDELTTHMEKSNFDEEFQKFARLVIDEIFSTL